MLSYNDSSMHIETVRCDEHNEVHATRHGVSIAEIVQVFTNDPEVRRNRCNRRADYVATGVTDGRGTRPRRLRPRSRGRNRPTHCRMESHVSRRSPEQTAHVADDAYARAEDRADGDLVDMQVSKNLTTVVSVRLSAEDLGVLEQAARRAGVKLSVFLRSAALSVARDEEVISRSEAVAAVEMVEKALQALRAAAGHKKDRLLA